MKRASFFLSLLALFIFENGFAQFESIPLKSRNPILFGNDIILNNNPTENQRQVSICSAFNGWLYAMYTYVYSNSSQNFAAGALLKSVDNGMTWTVLWDSYIPNDNTEFKSMDITVIGDSVSNLKVFLAFIFGSQTYFAGYATVNRYNGITGALESQMFVHDGGIKIAIAHDFNYPAFNSNPYSLGVIYSKHSYQDSIVFYSSSNGGMFFDTRVDVASSPHCFGKVALTYGRSLSENSGRYYAAWEEKDSVNSNLGHIYTAHSEPNFNSQFTSPVMLDSLNTNTYNKVRNPSIACQYNNLDNDSTNLTEVVLCDKYLPSENRNDIQGFYNMKSTNTTHFNLFSINSSPDNRQQPSIASNTFDNNFMVTFYDSTTQKLPFLVQDYNFINPNNWQVITAGYNDSNNLASPYPKVALNIAKQQAAMVWSSEGASGKGLAMFDAPYLTTGIRDNKHDQKINAFPNPANTFINIAFQVSQAENIQISLISLEGKIIQSTVQFYEPGFHKLKLDLSELHAGTYIYSSKSNEGSSFGKFVIMR